MRQLTPSGHFHRDVKSGDAHAILLDFHKIETGEMTADQFVGKHRSDLESIIRDKAKL